MEDAGKETVLVKNSNILFNFGNCTMKSEEQTSLLK